MPSSTSWHGELGIHDRVIITGSVVDTARYYRAFDVFALSSDTEQMPLSVLEAMASGLPVVSTDVGDVAEMIRRPGWRAHQPAWRRHNVRETADCFLPRRLSTPSGRGGESRASRGTLQPVANDRFLSTIVSPAADGERTGGLN